MDAGLVLPPLLPLADAGPAADFRVEGGTGWLWFERRSDVLLVSFDNLATLDHPYPRLPWLHRHAQEMGYSLLGVQSQAKDWFRTPAIPQMLRDLQGAGFFDAFSSIVFIGASMGGFAALTLATLVPRARVLAFSPQSTMNRKIAPFEGRFGWAVRRTDWNTPAFLDAMETLPQVAAASILFDPFVPEDKAHARRLAAPNVQMVPLGHATHEAVRVVLKSGALQPMIREFAETGRVGPVFRAAMRDRRTVRKWARAFVAAVVATGKPRRILAVADTLRDKDYLFVEQARKAAAEMR